MLKAGNKGMLKITSIDSLIECVELYKTITKVDDTHEVSQFFEDFLKQVTQLAKIQKFFHNTIYHCLYEFYYDPHQDDSEDEYQQGELVSE